MQNKQVKGFTLIELLIVIGIIAILATVVILTLNPAELLRQSRDTTRFSDLSTLNSAIALYLSDVPAAYLGTSTTWCFTSLDASSTLGTAGNQCGFRFPSLGAGAATVGATTSRAINGTGWIPIDFTKISTGSPLPQLPVDPVVPNTFGPTVTTTSDDFYYAYMTGTNNTYEVNTRIESQKFSSSSVNDGGNSVTLYEVGTNPGLAL
ncbi:MAG: type II secretion system protein [Candidatus Paceibacterota bacterium]|jgi:prepilin-type N-terminal cleavage/methylation domain-containing protein